MLSTNRKRARSNDDVCSPQKKVFVNQQRIDSLDEKKIKNIQDKTVNMLFKAARNLKMSHSLLTNKSKDIRLNGNGTFKILDEDAKKSVSVRMLSKCCRKLAVIIGECSNCNLCLCEFCGCSCVECGTPLCLSCVQIFECGNEERPCCRFCQYLHS